MKVVEYPHVSDSTGTQPLIHARSIEKTFPAKKRTQDVKALAGVDLEIMLGETVGLVGESGSGKSTLGRLLVGLDSPTRGEVVFNGKPITTANDVKFRSDRKHVQFVFQDPMAALNPRLTIDAQIAEPLMIHKGLTKDEALKEARKFAERVGINNDMAGRYIHQLSGGQRQRAVIARALVVNPSFVVFDEPTSALDLSIQAQILDLIRDLKENLQLTSVFISHDLRVVRYISDRIVVLYLGHIVEIGHADDVFHNAIHPYTQSLLRAIPKINAQFQPQETVLINDLPTSSTNNGCCYVAQCPHRTPQCISEVPQLRQVSADRKIACHLM